MRPEAVESGRRGWREPDCQRGYRNPRGRRGAARAALGVDVIVTDHHLPEAELPPALAVLNPNRADCAYPEKNLCGAGVAFKLAQALFWRALGWPAEKQRRVAESFLKIVAIATVADVVPLTGENRIIVKHGLDGLRAVRNPGLRALLDVAGFTGRDVPSARQVAFQIAPRINAAGRMDTAQAVVELFLTADPARARKLAGQLHEQNAERQQVEAAIRDACERTPWTMRPPPWSTTAKLASRGAGHCGQPLGGATAPPGIRAGPQPRGWAGARLRPEHSGVPSARSAGVDGGSVRALRRHQHAAGVTLDAGARGRIPRAFREPAQPRCLAPEDFQSVA